MRAIKEYNYHPNAHARTLASGRSKMIGLLVSDIANPFFPELVKSIEAAAFEHDFNVLLFNTDYDAERAADYVRRLIELKVAGVVMMTTELDPSVIDELERGQVQVVFHNLGTVGKYTSNIMVDYAMGIEAAVRYLVSLGHRKIAHFAGPSYFRSAVSRRQAFIDSMARHLPGEPAPSIYEVSQPPLTTVCSPRLEIGRKAIEALMMTIKHPGQGGTEIHLSTHLVIRESCGPPRKAARTKRGF